MPKPTFAELHQSEKAFLGTVVEYAEVNGWKVYHQLDVGWKKCPLCSTLMVAKGTRIACPACGHEEPVKYAKRIGKGFPDLVMAKRNRVVFAELKSEKGPVSEDQEEWLTVLRTVRGVRTFL